MVVIDMSSKVIANFFGDGISVYVLDKTVELLTVSTKIPEKVVVARDGEMVELKPYNLTNLNYIITKEYNEEGVFLDFFVVKGYHGDFEYLKKNKALYTKVAHLYIDVMCSLKTDNCVLNAIKCQETLFEIFSNSQKICLELESAIRRVAINLILNPKDKKLRYGLWCVSTGNLSYGLQKLDFSLNNNEIVNIISLAKKSTSKERAKPIVDYILAIIELLDTTFVFPNELEFSDELKFSKDSYIDFDFWDLKRYHIIQPSTKEEYDKEIALQNSMSEFILLDILVEILNENSTISKAKCAVKIVLSIEYLLQLKNEIQDLDIDVKIKDLISFCQQIKMSDSEVIAKVQYLLSLVV